MRITRTCRGRCLRRSREAVGHSARNRIFGEDLFHPRNRLFGGLLRRHVVQDYVGPAGRKHMFVAALGVGRIEHKELRDSLPEQTLLDIGLAMGSSFHQGSFSTIDFIAGILRPRPTLRYSLHTSGCIKNFRKSFATSTFFAPLGIIPPVLVTTLGIGFPSLLSGNPIVMMSSYSSFFLIIATSVEIEPSRSITIVLEWKALLSSASFQLMALGGTKPSL